MTHLKTAIETGKMHPEVAEMKLHAMELFNIYDENDKGWFVGQKGPGRKITPMGDGNAPFRYETKAEAEEDLKAFNLWAQEVQGNA